MVTTLVYDNVLVESEGNVNLPRRILQAGGLETGDALVAWWLPPDQIILRKLSSLTDGEFNRAMDEFSSALDGAGYDTRDKVTELVQEVKREQAREMLAGW